MTYNEAFDKLKEMLDDLEELSNTPGLSSEMKLSLKKRIDSVGSIIQQLADSMGVKLDNE
jgi:hypothetical protein